MARESRGIRHPGQGRCARGTHRRRLLERGRTTRSGAPEAGPRPARVAGISAANAAQVVRYTLPRGPVAHTERNETRIGPQERPPRGGLISPEMGLFSYVTGFGGRDMAVD